MPILETERLTLRPLRRSDAAEFTRLAGDWAGGLDDQRHPLSVRRTQAKGWLTPIRGEVRFAIEREGQLIGGVGFYRRPPAPPSSASGSVAPGGVAAMPRRLHRRSCSMASRCIACRASRRRISSTIRRPGACWPNSDSCRPAVAGSAAPRAGTTSRCSPSGSTAARAAWRCRPWRRVGEPVQARLAGVAHTSSAQERFPSAAC